MKVVFQALTMEAKVMCRVWTYRSRWWDIKVDMVVMLVMVMGMELGSGEWLSARGG